MGQLFANRIRYIGDQEGRKIGDIVMATAAPGDEFVLCNGAMFSTTDYPNLSSTIPIDSGKSYVTLDSSIGYIFSPVGMYNNEYYCRNGATIVKFTSFGVASTSVGNVPTPSNISGSSPTLYRLIFDGKDRFFAIWYADQGDGNITCWYSVSNAGSPITGHTTAYSTGTNNRMIDAWWGNAASKWFFVKEQNQFNPGRS